MLQRLRRRLLVTVSCRTRIRRRSRTRSWAAGTDGRGPRHGSRPAWRKPDSPGRRTEAGCCRAVLSAPPPSPSCTRGCRPDRAARSFEDASCLTSARENSWLQVTKIRGSFYINNLFSNNVFINMYNNTVCVNNITN